MNADERRQDQERLLREFGEQLTPRGKSMNWSDSQRWNAERASEHAAIVAFLDRIGVPRVDPRLLKEGFVFGEDLMYWGEQPIDQRPAYEILDILTALFEGRQEQP